jgi:hypothetical protein
MFEGAMEIGCIMRAGMIKNVILNALCLPLELSRQCIHGVDPLVAMITSTATATVVALTGQGGEGGKGCQFSSLSHPHSCYLIILKIARTKTNEMTVIVYHPSEKPYLVP